MSAAEIPPSHPFEHEAMNTTYHLRICHPDPKLALGMAQECFSELDRLESHLSRFLEDSDVARINQMQAGEQLFIAEETHACLLQALDYHARTHGLFDVTLGRAIEHRKSEADGPPPPLEGSLIIHPDRAAVTCEIPGREIDLGGIGKGFALDHLRKRLLDWGAEGGLLAAGASTQLAFGEASWPVELTGDQSSKRIDLSSAALSASGTGVQGSHIVHPDGGVEELSWKRVWLTTQSATAADVWSTTLMLLTDAEVLQVSEIIDEIDALFVEDDDGIRAID